MKGTEICFQNFYKIKNLITNEEDYLLILQNRNTIRFSKKIEFLNQFISILKQNINDLNEEFKEFQNRERNEVIIDENEIFLRHEHIRYWGE